ncbi:MAG: ABC transporter permease [Planctomyces sp.]
MRIPRLIPELPLLRRELIELSARRRTYIVRSLGALVLLGWVVYLLNSSISELMQYQLQGAARGGGMRGMSLMGAGSILFPRLVPSLFMAVQLLMPSLVCGSITTEKERNTLGTLFVTRLSPLTIVLEKLGSRLMPMLTFLLLSFPMLAFVYSLGGVDQRLLLSTLWLVFWECLLYGSIGLMCSAWYTTTVGAFVASYVLSAVLYTLTRLSPVWFPTPWVIWQYVAYFPMLGYVSSGQGFVVQWMSGFATRPALVVFGATLPTMLTVLFCLTMTRVLLYRRAFVSQSSLLLRMFRRLDVFFQRLNDRAGGVQVIADRESWPEFDPVAWREREKKSLGRARYLIRMLVALEFPTLFVCLLAVMFGAAERSQGGLGALWVVAWLLALMIVSVKAATLISSERARETLDALLSTPMTGREILLQKVAGMRRLMMVVATPILTVNVSNVMMAVQSGGGVTVSNLGQWCWLMLYLVLVVFSTWTALHLLAWLSLLTGGGARSQARSVFTAVTVALLGVWLSVFVVGESRLDRGDYWNGRVELTPELLQGYQLANGLRQLFRIDGALQAHEYFLRVLSPNQSVMFAGPTIVAGFGEWPMLVPCVLSCVLAFWHWLLMRGCRWLALRRATRLFGREDELGVVAVG